MKLKNVKPLRQQESFGKNQEKTGKAVRWAGHSNFLLKRGPLRERSGVKRLQPKVFFWLCGEGLCGKEAFLLT